MRWLRFAVLILIVTVLQAGLLENLRIKPDLLLILVVFFAIYCNSFDAIITSFTIGFAADIIAPVMMGPKIISFGLLGTLLAYLHRVIATRKMSYQALAIFIVAFLAGLLAHLLTFLKGGPTAPDFYTLFWTSLCSALVGPFLFLPSAWWMHIKTHRFRRY
ncbi:MAG: rod shape-determining protein MreD [Planctomycetota bacterium]|jgi:rod shape-determining protein MreD